MPKFEVVLDFLGDGKPLLLLLRGVLVLSLIVLH
jgi:hypothetical protein